MYMYTGFCILSILWKQKEENIDVKVYWVLYSQYSLETERRKHRCKSILGSVFSVFSETKRRKHRCTYSQIFKKQKEENIDVKVYWVLYSQYFQETERRKHRCKSILGSVFSVFSGNRKKKT